MDMVSSPYLNVLHSQLNSTCGLNQFWLHDSTGWPSNEKLYTIMNLPLYYNLASFKRG